ncbi:kinase-like protein, partial [Atractiella rhizophila]
MDEGGSERVEIPSRPKSADPDVVRSSKIVTVPTPPSSEKKKKQKQTKERKKVSLDDFEIVKVLGKGCAGKVMLVRHGKTGGRYAMKAIHKHHVLAHRELQHTLTEQSVLKRVAKDQSNPFVVKLYWSFHDEGHLYLVLDFYPGGDLATQLARWGRLGRDRARFYAAEIVEGTVGLHRAGVIYRDLKPENILIAADGHIVLTDFGLSKQFERAWLETKDTTSTFCGTAEYLAPEVLLGEPYSYEVDWWSFGTMLYEMLTGLTPFWSEDHSTMYRKVLHDDLVFDEDSRVLDQDTKSLIRGLLQKVPGLRMTDARIKRHPYFSMIDWSHVYHKRYIPPYIPTLDPLNDMDTQNFDETFL